MGACSPCQVRTLQESNYLQARKTFLTRTQQCWHPDVSDLKPSELGEINFCCLSYAVYGIVSWKSEKTKTLPYRWSSKLLSRLEYFLTSLRLSRHNYSNNNMKTKWYKIRHKVTSKKRRYFGREGLQRRHILCLLSVTN